MTNRISSLRASPDAGHLNASPILTTRLESDDAIDNMVAMVCPEEITNDCVNKQRAKVMTC